MSKGRLEAFSDGVIAIIITIMVLELKVPEKDDLHSLLQLYPVFLSYLLSFIFVGIYWNNHHHTFQVVKSVNGAALWANMHLLFWLSLVPFVTSWMGEHHFARWPVTVYGLILLMNAIAYSIMTSVLIKNEGADSTLAQAIGKNKKGDISIVLYSLAVVLSWVNSNISLAIYITVALMWLIPDKRIESRVVQRPSE